mgnify:FL=1
MRVEDAQRELSRAYANGGPAVAISGVVWIIASIIDRNYGTRSAFNALFLGGMLIVPISILVSRKFFGAEKTDAKNPLNRLGFESTMMLFAGLLISYALLPVAPNQAFAALAAAIGARYFTFRSIYGSGLFWGLGGALMTVATVSLLKETTQAVDVLTAVGVIECVFGILLMWHVRRHTKQIKRS